MRKPLQIGLIAALVVFAAATVALWARNSQTSSAYASLQSEQETARQRYSQTLDAIAEIQDSLNAISVGDANVQMHQTVGAEGKSTQETQQEVLDRIAVMRESIAHNKARIRQLESSLNKSGVKVDGMQKMIASLKKSVEEKEQIVAQLQAEVESLQNQVTGLETEVAQVQETVRVKDESLEQRRRELATVYYVVGDKKNLKDAGIVEAKGGVLGLGKTIQTSGKFNETQAKAIDTDQETVVVVPSKQARVLSAQPASSYELRLVGNQTELHITNPTEFRKVKQLVILT